MWAATLRGMIAHKLRLVLTTASISLGVAFLAGTLVLTDTMGLAFEQLFGKVSAGTDAVVRTQAPTPLRKASPRAAARSPPRPCPRSSRRRCPGGRRGGERVRADDRQRRSRRAQQRRRADGGLELADDDRLRGDVELLSGTAPRAATRSPSTPPAPRSTTSRSAPRSRCCSTARPRSSPSWARSGSPGRRTWAAPPRRTSTPRPRNGARIPGSVRLDRRQRRTGRHPGSPRRPARCRRSCRGRSRHRRHRGEGDRRCHVRRT